MKPITFFFLFFGAAGLAFSQYGIPEGWRLYVLLIGVPLIYIAGIRAGIEIEREYPKK